MLILIATLIAATVDFFFVRPRATALKPKADRRPSFWYLWLNEAKIFLDGFWVAGVVFLVLCSVFVGLDNKHASVNQLLRLHQFLASLKLWTNPLKLSPLEGLGVTMLIYALSFLYRPWQKALPKNYGRYRKVIGRVQGVAGALAMFTLFGSVAGPPQVNPLGRVELIEHTYGSIQNDVTRSLVSRADDELLRRVYREMPPAWQLELRREGELHSKYSDVADELRLGIRPDPNPPAGLAKVIEVDRFDDQLAQEFRPVPETGGSTPTGSNSTGNLSESEVDALRENVYEGATWVDRKPLLEELGFRTEVARELTGRLADLPLSVAKEHVLALVRDQYPALGRLLDTFCNAGTEVIKARARERSTKLTRDLLVSPRTYEGFTSTVIASAAHDVVDPLPSPSLVTDPPVAGRTPVLAPDVAAQAREELNRMLEAELRSDWHHLTERLGSVNQRTRSSRCSILNCTSNENKDAEFERFMRSVNDLPLEKRSLALHQELARIHRATGRSSVYDVVYEAHLPLTEHIPELHLPAHTRLPGGEPTIEVGGVEIPEELPHSRVPIEVPRPRIPIRPVL